LLNFEQAVDKAKTFLAKMKGYNIEFSGRLMIDWLDFEVEKQNETSDQFDLTCSFQENLFGDQRVKFFIRIDRVKGEVVDVQRISQ